MQNQCVERDPEQRLARLGRVALPGVGWVRDVADLSGRVVHAEPVQDHVRDHLAARRLFRREREDVALGTKRRARRLARERRSHLVLGLRFSVEEASDVRVGAHRVQGAEVGSGIGSQQQALRSQRFDELVAGHLEARLVDGRMSGMVDDAAGIDPALGFVPHERDLARAELRHELLRCKTFVAGVVILAFWVVAAVVGSSFRPHDEFADTGRLLAPPSLDHWFGTDALGRDVFDRVLFGAADTLTVAPLATLIGLVGGTIIGMLAGFYVGSLFDDIVGRIVDAVLALPLLVLAVLVIAATGNQSKTSQALVIGIAFIPAIARTVRATVLAERDLDYVQAAQLQGERAGYTMVLESSPT